MALGTAPEFDQNKSQNEHSRYSATEAVPFAAPVLRRYAEANHSFGYELSMRVGQVILQRLQATRAKLVDFYAAIKDD